MSNFVKKLKKSIYYIFIVFLVLYLKFFKKRLEMEFKDIKELIRLFDKSELNKLKIKDGEFEISMQTGFEGGAVVTTSVLLYKLYNQYKRHQLLLLQHQLQLRVHLLQLVVILLTLQW